MDHGIGEIMDTLKSTGQLDNTLVVFLQDNGGCDESIGRTDPHPRKNARGGVGVMPGANDTFISYGRNWANVSDTPFKLYKHYVHEGGISTPLVVSWPDGLHRHGVFERQTGHLIDLMPTFGQYTGALRDLAGMDVPGADLRGLAPFSPESRAPTQPQVQTTHACGAGNHVCSVSVQGDVSPCSFLGPAFHGRGHGTTALRLLMRHLVEERGHHRITIDPAADNAAAIRSYGKAGFTPVGVMRAAWRDPDGRWRDLLLMEWVDPAVLSRT